MSEIIIENLNKTYPARKGEKKSQVISNLDLHVKQGQTISLLGPSGCGKTTTLRSIAGLEVPDSGTIRIGDKTVYGKGVWVPPHLRNIGMVFQSYALWPHLSVFDNVAYPLKQKKVKADEIKKRVHGILDLVGIGHLHHRSPGQLSGGQQQRVALARSLVSQPEVILFDEPLSNLDAKLRKQMRIELSELQDRIEFTSVYVTHDRIEALNISDYIAVMAGGRILQYDNIVTITREIGKGVAEASFGTVHCGQVKEVMDTSDVFHYADLMIAVPPDAIEIGMFAKAEPNCWEGVIRNLTFMGTSVEYIVQVGNQSINVIPSREFQHLKPGDSVMIHIPPEKIIMYRYCNTKAMEASEEVAVGQ